MVSYFQIPVSTCHKQRQMIAYFWWGREGGNKKLHWRSWECLSAPKSLGGLGFRDLVLFNQAMLGRQCWRLLTEPDYLCARVLKGRYFPNGDFWDAPKPRSSSYTWRSILFGWDLMKKGIQWNIGDGRKVKILSDNWIPDTPPNLVHSLLPIPVCATVNYLMFDGHASWNEEMVRAIFPARTAEQIMQTQISQHGGSDYVSWPHTRYGLYTICSVYNLARSAHFFVEWSLSGHGLPSDWDADVKHWKALWAIKSPTKMNIVLQCFAHNRLPSGLQLNFRNIATSPACIFCNREESIKHSLLFYQFAWEVWRQVKSQFDLILEWKNFHSPKQWLIAPLTGSPLYRPLFFPSQCGIFGKLTTQLIMVMTMCSRVVLL